MTIKFFVLFLITAILGFGSFTYITRAVSNTQVAPEVVVSFDALVQADTLLVVVKNEPTFAKGTTGSGGEVKITGTLGTVKMHFYRSENGADWIALVGMPVNKKPGIYKLVINVPGKSLFKKDITVSKRNFPITNMVITPKLSEKGYTVKKIITTIKNTENKALNKVLTIFTPIAYVAKPFGYPLAEINIVGRYGDIRAAKNYKIQHLGVDLKAPLATNVYAVNNGQVVFTESLPDYGNTLILDHGLGVYSLYLHLAEFKAKKGIMVKQGDVIALSGETGYATGPHLHFSIKVRGASVDPLRFIEATQTMW